jgi:magnesium chelatase family protein
LPEFKKSTLETLRQPLEDGSVTISRTAHTITYPSRCMLGAAMNPCPCGYLQDALGRCLCSAEAVRRYRGKVSGPMLDRIDLHIEVTALPVDELMAERLEEPSSAVRMRVIAARAIQRHRFRNCPGLHCNAHMSPRELRRFCPLPSGAGMLLREAVESLGLSARAYDRILKVARTLADLEACEDIEERHLAEGIHYRCLDRRPMPVSM